MLKRCHSWVLKRKQEHKDFHLTSFHYEHLKLGTSLLHLSCPDPQKAFALMFRTPPPNNSGVSHCLERLTSSGSSSYPVHNPVQNTLPFSQSSYASAWTGSDFTMYPFATINHKDFHNLFSIYTDSCFFPLLTYPDFLYQVCHIQDINGELKYNGLIYNEMKEKVWDSNETLIQTMMKELFSGTCYEFNPGGDFLTLAKLTHSELRAYHQEFYHPSNATLFFYGDLDVMRYAEALDQQVFSKFERKKVDSRAKIAKNQGKSEQISLKIPDFGSNTGKFAKGYLCDAVDKDYYTNFLMNILSCLLFDVPNAPLYKALIVGGLGTELIPGYGFDQSTRQGSFMVALDGVGLTDDKKIELTIKKTLEDLIEKRIESSLIEDALHQLEIKYKECKPNFGLQLISSMIPYALHSLDPFVPLYINTYVNKLRTSLAQNEPVFESLIEKYLISNKNSVQIFATPDKSLIQEMEKLEQVQVQRLGFELQRSVSEYFQSNSSEIEKTVNNSNNVEVLPGMSVDDLNTDLDIPKFDIETVVCGLKVKYLISPTNGLTYLRIKSDIIDLPEPLRELLPLYSTIINYLGTTKHSQMEFSLLKSKYTVAGITTSFQACSSLDSLDKHSESLTFKIAFVDRNLDHAIEILEEFLTQVAFENTENLTDLIQQDVKRRTDQLIANSHILGASLACSSLTAAANSFEQLRILKHDCYLSAQLLTSLSNQSRLVNDILSKLKQIHAFVLNKPALDVLVHTGDAEMQQALGDRLEFLENSLRLSFESFEVQRVPLEIPQFQPFVYQAYFTLPVEGSCVNEAFLGCQFSSMEFAALKVVAEIVNSGIYCENLELVASADWVKGSFVFSTNNDPDCLRTFNLFEKVIWAVTEGKFTDQDIKKAKISVFAKLDSPIAVYERGLEHFLYGLNSETWKTFRRSLTQVTRENIIAAAQKYLGQPLEKGLSSKVVFGKEDVNTKELKEAGWIVQPPIEIISNR